MKPMCTINSAQVLFLLFLCSGAYAQIESVKIGKQEWTVKNLDVAGFRNGDLISEVKGVAEWMAAGEAGKPAWCYFGNNPANGTKNGKLYNWFAVSDPRGLCPTGWHVPSDEEWTQLTVQLGGKLAAGTKMKSVNGWEAEFVSPGNGNNESGFSCFPGGFRYYDGDFYGIGEDGHWWSTSAGTSGSAWSRVLDIEDGAVGRASSFEENGFSVRCLKD